MHPAPLQATEVPHLAAPSSIDKLREWQIKNGDLAVGPLGGLNGRCHCAACRAPLFSREANTKCCLGRLREGAEWYGPFCTYPYVQRPTGEYGSLWYNDTDADAKYFRGNTRLLNCRYAYSSLQVLSRDPISNSSIIRAHTRHAQHHALSSPTFGPTHHPAALAFALAFASVCASVSRAALHSTAEFTAHAAATLTPAATAVIADAFAAATVTLTRDPNTDTRTTTSRH